MKYLSFPIEQDAKQRSAGAWLQRLGRPKNPEDITEFLWSTYTDIDGKSLVMVDGNEDLLTPQDTVATDIPPSYSTMFVLITDTVPAVTTFLENRGLIERDEQGQWVAIREGLAWQQKPNPILINGVADTRKVFLVRLTMGARHEDYDGTASPDAFQFSKFAKWVLNNSSIQTAPASYQVGGQPLGDAYKVTGQSVWLVRDNPERFGTWEDETVEPVQLVDGGTDLGLGHGSS